MVDDVFLTEQQFRNIFRDHLKVEANQKTIDSLFAPRLRTRINFEPYYQRNYVWDVAKASYFIESIMLGTEIPPLIFFKHGENIEVIDGRQRFETIDRFIKGELALSTKGLDRLKGLGRSSWGKLTQELVTQFLDTKLRIIWFEIVGDPPLESQLEDKIKKEIFRRYNTGITPLRRAELDNAIYDSDEVTKELKAKLAKNTQLAQRVRSLFLHTAVTQAGISEQITQFVRRSLILHRYPIRYYAWGSSRTETLEHLYDVHIQQGGIVAAEIVSEMESYVNAIDGLWSEARQLNVEINRYFNECVLWALTVLKAENKNPLKELQRLKSKLLEYAATKHVVFYVDASHFHTAIMGRYEAIGEFFQLETGVNFNIYLTGGDTKPKDLRPNVDTARTNELLGELSELRVNKPAPSTASIDDVMRSLRKRRYLLRPSYQRGEVINPSKASGIIESILLKVPLPPIFVFERNDGVLEVVDGQQRLLTIIGFIGERYTDSNGAQVSPDINEFALKDLRILTELDGKRFRELPQERQNQIWDFDLFIVDIQQEKNPSFDPVDLFVRLNDKPYPIKEHSFEMWNSWADKDSIDRIKKVTHAHADWFYIRRRHRDGYRMQNEELIASLAFLEYCREDRNGIEGVEIYDKGTGISVRFKNKAAISGLWTELASDEQKRKRWLDSISRVDRFLKNLKTTLIDQDATSSGLDEFLRQQLDALIKGADARSGYASRSQQGIYILWQLIAGLTPTIVEHRRDEIKRDIMTIMDIVRSNFADEEFSELKPSVVFNRLRTEFREKYSTDERKLKLNKGEIDDLLKRQGGLCGISGKPIYKGDALHADHIVPLSRGGRDVPENIQLTLPSANLSKGSKEQSEL